MFLLTLFLLLVLVFVASVPGRVGCVVLCSIGLRSGLFEHCCVFLWFSIMCLVLVSVNWGGVSPSVLCNIVLVCLNLSVCICYGYMFICNSVMSLGY